jgi:hypothetical protein
VVDGGKAREFPGDGTENVVDTPGWREARRGSGSEGSFRASLKMLGTDFPGPLEDPEDETRCALLRLGNAGGISWSRSSVSVSSPSSSDGGGETSKMTGAPVSLEFDGDDGAGTAGVIP